MAEQTLERKTPPVGVKLSPDVERRAYRFPRAGALDRSDQQAAADPLNRRATHWDSLVVELGLPNLKRHGLRHTGATWLADSGVPLHVLQ